MVEPSSSIDLIPTDPIQLALTLILSGGLVAGTYEWIRYFFNKRREEKMEMERHKMEKIANCAPYYNQLVVFSFSFSRTLEKTPIDVDLSLFYLSRVLNIYHKIFTQYGGIQLDSLISEKIVVELGNSYFSLIGKPVGASTMHRIRALTENTDNYFVFKTKIIPQITDLRAEFSDWLIKSKDLTELKQKSYWFGVLLEFELNVVYQLWYEREPNIDRIDIGLWTYLEKADLSYYNRLRSIETGKFRIYKRYK